MVNETLVILSESGQSFKGFAPGGDSSEILVPKAQTKTIAAGYIQLES